VKEDSSENVLCLYGDNVGGFVMIGANNCGLNGELLHNECRK